MDFSADFSKVKNMYETTFLVVPDNGESEYKKVVEKFEKMIKDHDGEIINLEHWGLRKLAYPIKKRNNAHYCFIEYKSTAPLIQRMEQEFTYDERIIRYLTVKLDKYHVAFNKKRREQGFGKKRDGSDSEPRKQGERLSWQNHE